MSHPPTNLPELIEEAKTLGPIRIAVVNAAQRLVLEAVREAQSLGLIEPRLIGEPDSIIASAGNWAPWPLSSAASSCSPPPGRCCIRHSAIIAWRSPAPMLMSVIPSMWDLS